MKMNTKVKMICLCGGKGERMEPLSFRYPKSILPLGDNGEYNIVRNINLVGSAVPLDKVIVVCSEDYKDKYSKEIIEGSHYEVTFVSVDNRHNYNNWYSMKRALDYISHTKGFFVNDNKIVVAEGDLYLRDEIVDHLKSLIKESEETRRNYYLCSYRKGEWVTCKTPNEETVVIKNGNGLAISGIALINTTWRVLNLRNYLNRGEAHPQKYWDDFFLELFGSSIYPYDVGDSVVEFDTIKDLLDSKLMTPKEIADLIDLQGSATPVDSMTNTSFVVRIDDKKKVLRLPGIGTEDFINRDREVAVYRYLMDSFCAVDDELITPRTEFFKDGVKLTDYIPCSRVSTDKDTYKVLNKLARLHSIELPSMQENGILLIDIIEEVENYEKLYNNNLVETSESPGIVEYYKEVRKFYKDKIRALQNKEVVLCHRDLDPRNILITDPFDEEYLIDFEYSGISNRYWDLGAYVSELKLFFDYDALEDDKFYDSLKQYEKSTGLKCDRGQIELWSGIVDFVWSCWTIAKISLGEDYKDYLERRWRRCCEIYEKHTTLE